MAGRKLKPHQTGEGRLTISLSTFSDTTSIPFTIQEYRAPHRDISSGEHHTRSHSVRPYFSLFQGSVTLRNLRSRAPSWQGLPKASAGQLLPPYLRFIAFARVFDFLASENPVFPVFAL